jgi:hypothetical protein
VKETRRDWTVPILIATLGALEILVLYVLLFFETPLTPFARRALETVGGTISLVLGILCVLMAGWAVLLALIKKRKEGRGREGAV